MTRNVERYTKLLLESSSGGIPLCCLYCKVFQVMTVPVCVCVE